MELAINYLNTNINIIKNKISLSDFEKIIKYVDLNNSTVYENYSNYICTLYHIKDPNKIANILYFLTELHSRKKYIQHLEIVLNDITCEDFLYFCYNTDIRNVDILNKLTDKANILFN